MLKENIDLETEIDSSDIFEWFEGNNSLKQNIIDTNIDWKKDAEIDSSNIFKWFEGDINLKQDIIDINESSDKDIYYYLSKVWKFNEIVFIFFLLFTIIAYWYVSIQKNEEIINSGSLDPFCKIILWDIENPDSLKSLMEYSIQHPNIIYVDITFGGSDFEFDIEVKNHKEFQKIIQDIKTKFPGLIRTYKYYKATKIHKYSYLPEIQS